jgi:hypothetical protein
MYPSYKQMNAQILSLTQENWLNALKQRLPERPGYRLENGTIFFGQISGKFFGLPLDEDEYYNELFDYVHSMETGLNLLSEDSLDKSINNQQFQAIQKVLNINKDQKLSINRFTAFLDGEQLLLKPESAVLHRRIREAMVLMLELFASKEAEGLRSNELRRILVDVIKWSFNHLEPLLANIDPETEMPKFLWYGEFKKSHSYLLFFLLKFGCDVLIFQPEGKDVLEGFPLEYSFVHQYPEKKAALPFPKEKRARKSTVAYRASREIESILNQEGSGLYKPWQLRDYTPTSVTLKTTYDELFILIKEIAMVRPNFEVKNGRVSIPTLFSKVQGVSKNRKEYWERLQMIADFDHTLLIKHLPFTTTTSNDFRFHYRNALDKEGLLDVEKMKAANYWKYSHLPNGLQQGIGYAIRKLCEKPPLKPFAGENSEELKTYLFSQAMQTGNSMIQLMQKFDYSQDVPKLVLYNNGLSGSLIRSDAALLLLLNQFGIDIVIYNPAGHNDIENFVEDDLFDTHWLEDVVFEQEYKEPSSFLKKGFFQGILKNLRGD